MHSKATEDSRSIAEQRQPLILIVDDNHDNLLFASCVVKYMELNYIITDNSEECLEIARKLLPDIILLDVVMPKISGIDVTKIIRQDKNISHLSIIAVTGLTSTRHKQELREAGFDDYICKPYLIEDLESKIDRFL